MSKPEKYYQCTIKKGTGRDVAYLEERAALVGNFVEIGGYGTNDFWEVENVSSSYLRKDQLKGLEKIYREGFNSIKPRTAKTESL